MPSDDRHKIPIPDFSHRAQLSELMDEPCSREEMKACLRDLARLNRWFLSDHPLLAWLGRELPKTSRPVRILDVGCGDGEPLRRIARWARSRRIAVELLGLDLNPLTISIAKEITPHEFPIRWVAADIFAFVPDQPIHYVISSLFTHHLTEDQIVSFLHWMERNAQSGWFINDLSRAAVPFYFLKFFTRFAGLHPFVQHDAPVSVARAFVEQDWHNLCDAAGLSPDSVTIQPFRPGRLCVSRNKSQ